MLHESRYGILSLSKKTSKRYEKWESRFGKLQFFCWHSTWFGHISLVTFGDLDSRFFVWWKVTDFIKSHQEASFNCWKICCKEHRSRLNLMGYTEKNHQSTQVGPHSISASQSCQPHPLPNNQKSLAPGSPGCASDTCEYMQVCELPCSPGVRQDVLLDHIHIQNLFILAEMNEK